MFAPRGECTPVENAPAFPQSARSWASLVQKIEGVSRTTANAIRGEAAPRGRRNQFQSVPVIERKEARFI